MHICNKKLIVTHDHLATSNMIIFLSDITESRVSAMRVAKLDLHPFFYSMQCNYAFLKTNALSFDRIYATSIILDISVLTMYLTQSCAEFQNFQSLL